MCQAETDSEAAFTSTSTAGFNLHNNNVMAAQSAAKAINTQEIIDKARRDLLHLLEAVCKHGPVAKLETSY